MKSCTDWCFQCPVIIAPFQMGETTHLCGCTPGNIWLAYNPISGKTYRLLPSNILSKTRLGIGSLLLYLSSWRAPILHIEITISHPSPGCRVWAVGTHDENIHFGKVQGLDETIHLRHRPNGGVNSGTAQQKPGNSALELQNLREYRKSTYSVKFQLTDSSVYGWTWNHYQDIKTFTETEPNDEPFGKIEPKRIWKNTSTKTTETNVKLRTLPAELAPDAWLFQAQLSSILRRFPTVKWGYPQVIHI
jgi:hypothetical protein